MTFEHGRLAVFKLESAGGVLTDLSPYVDDVQIDFTVDAATNTGLNRLSKDYDIGEMDGVISLSGSFHPTANTLLAALRGLKSARSWEYAPQGQVAGKVQITGKCKLVEYHLGTSIDDAGGWTTQLQMSDTDPVFGVY